MIIVKNIEEVAPGDMFIRIKRGIWNETDLAEFIEHCYSYGHMNYLNFLQVITEGVTVTKVVFKKNEYGLIRRDSSVG